MISRRSNHQKQTCSISNQSGADWAKAPRGSKIACTSIQSRPPVVAPKRVIMVPATEGNHSLETRSAHVALYCNDWNYEITTATKKLYNKSHDFCSPYWFCFCLFKPSIGKLSTLCDLYGRPAALKFASKNRMPKLLTNAGWWVSLGFLPRLCHMNPMLAYPQWRQNRRKHLTKWCVLSLGLYVFGVILSSALHIMIYCTCPCVTVLHYVARQNPNTKRVSMHYVLLESMDERLSWNAETKKHTFLRILGKC